MNPAAPPQLSVYIPIPITASLPRAPVARKAIPTRKPVGQPSTSTPRSAQSNPTEPRKSVSSTLSSSHTLSDSTNLSTNRSSISSFSTYSISQPQSQVKEELPSGWTSALDPDGRIYYMNHVTKATSWSKPELNPSQLSLGWEERMAPDGKVYYCNTQTQVTTWERPSTVPISTTESSLRQERTLSPLPLWWEERATSDGKVYFCNTQTQITTWERPPAVQKLAIQPNTTRSMQQEEPLSPLSSLWEEHTRSDGKTYFYNLQTGVTTWERPSAIPEHQQPVAAVNQEFNRSIVQEQTLSPLTSEWEERTTSDGRIYFCNKLTHTTTWERPSISSGQQAAFPVPTPESSRSMSMEQPPTPLSPGIDWETPQWQAKSGRRRSHFSLSSISSASSKTISKLKLPSSASSSAVMKGTKNAAELSMKGMKSAGKVLKNNKGVILVSVKLVNGILRETTGISLGGLEGLLEGDVEIGGGDEGDEIGEGSGSDEDEDAETVCEDTGGEVAGEEEVQEQTTQQDPIPRGTPISKPRKQNKKTADVIVREILPGQKKPPKAKKGLLGGSFAGTAKKELEKGIMGMLMGSGSDDSSGGEEDSGDENDDDIEENSEDEECEESENVVADEVIVEEQLAVEEQSEEEQYVVQDQQATPYTEDAHVEQENTEVLYAEEIIVQEELQPVEDTVVQEEFTIEQQAAFYGGFPGGDFWAEESNAWSAEDVLVDEQVGVQEEIVVEDTALEQTTSEDIIVGTTAFEESTLQETTYDETTVQEVTVEESRFQEMTFEQTTSEKTITDTVAYEQTTFQETSFEESTVQEVTVQDSICQETTFEETTLVQETTVEETVIVDGSATYVETEQFSVEETTVVTTEVQSVETVTFPPDLVLIQDPPIEPFLPVEQPPIELPSTFEQPLIPQAPPPSEAPLEPFIFEPILAGPMMVEPPAQSNGVIFAPTYV